MCGHTNMRKTPPLKFFGGYLMTTRPKKKTPCGGQRKRRERGGIHRCRRGRLHLKSMTNQDSFYSDSRFEIIE
ncbi:hypothetical protein ANCCAN_27310 [Ancylostoma caninum]|uniref:Uncharacterized protein n=1 Tax=Ancylostoma caninum TaxID=29170 RepID=A0A368F4J2_ANCCA|nr:hypothetical protein ANCCAN_27310 [Ancylostoma caninum]